jgi:hypothetical protein
MKHEDALKIQAFRTLAKAVLVGIVPRPLAYLNILHAIQMVTFVDSEPPEDLLDFARDFVWSAYSVLEGGEAGHVKPKTCSGIVAKLEAWKGLRHTSIVF